MKYEERRYRLTGIMPVLGGVALDKEVYTKYIATKARENEKSAALADAENVPDKDEEVTESITGFYRDKDGYPIMKGYQVKGFLKEAAKALKDQLGLASYLSKIDNLVFIKEQNLQIKRNGEVVKQIDGYLERPLRAETAKGPRVGLVKSERIDEGWEIEIIIRVLENSKTAKSCAMDFDVIENLLSYGEMKGMLQWRNAGYGSFVTDVLK